MLVAVVGAGIVGLTAIKNCLEEGFDVIAFERSSDLGGLWRYKEDDPSVTSVMEGTKTNFSKHRMCYTDFPFPDDAPLYPTGPWMVKYLEAYADRFNLRSYIKFDTAVSAVSFASPGPAGSRRFRARYRSSDKQKESSIEVDRMIFACGMTSQPYLPTIPGLQHFDGDVFHSREFRGAAKYKGKNVLVVGSRSSAADVATFLAANDAGKIYLSHRGGVLIINRMWRGKPFDFALTRRISRMQARLDHSWLAPYSGGYLLNLVCRFIAWTTCRDKKEWGFSPKPDIRSSVPAFSDDLHPLLGSGRVEPVPGLSSILPDSSIVLDSGRTLTGIDSIIFATGFKYDPAQVVSFSPDILAELGYDPSTPYRFPTYHHTLPLGVPEICFLDMTFSIIGVPVAADLRSMWIAGVWSGSVELPRREEMEAVAGKEQEWVDGLEQFGAVLPGTMPTEGLFTMAKEAGCQDDHTSWSSCTWEGWKWWWRHRALSRLVMDGPDTPASFKLRGRRAWTGAEEVIWKANGKVPPKTTSQ